jgi:cell division protein FtsB
MNWKLQLLMITLVLVVLGLQVRLWWGEGSFGDVANLKRQLAQQRSELSDLNERNAILQAEVDDLKKGLAAVEARARSELGLIRKGETYFQLLDPAETAGD